MFTDFERILAMVRSLEDFARSKEREEECIASINHTQNIIGGKWSFLVLGHLTMRPQRFNQMRRLLGDISTKSLTDTLRHLEQNGIISRTVFPTVPVTVEYALTEKGKELQAILLEMYTWGHRWRELEKEPASM
jgi:DNA-binding HxlR family transcriptional regulator